MQSRNNSHFSSVSTGVINRIIQFLKHFMQFAKTLIPLQVSNCQSSKKEQFMYSFSSGKWKNLSEMLLSRAPLEAASAAEFHLCLCGQEPCIYMYIYMSMDGRKQLGYDFLCMTAEAGS